MSLDVLQEIEKDAIGDGLQVVILIVAVGLFRGVWRRLRDTIHAGAQAQQDIAENQRRLVDQFDPSVPSGFSELVKDALPPQEQSPPERRAQS